MRPRLLTGPFLSQIVGILDRLIVFVFYQSGVTAEGIGKNIFGMGNQSLIAQERDPAGSAVITHFFTLNQFSPAAKNDAMQKHADMVQL